jgi:serine/threonine-protein kinase
MSGDALVESLGIAEGQTLANKYRVERVIGTGGMGVVVVARHVHVGERVAIKVLRPDVALGPVAVARFLREARAAMRLRSEHVVRVFDADLLSGSVPYIVMEYLAGRDLARELEAQGPLPVGVAVELVLQACEAVAEAHAAGIVHRDLKPANLFLTRGPDGSPTIKLLDFGVSKFDVFESDEADAPSRRDGAAPGSRDAPALTGATAALGSPRYMAPEQIVSSRRVDARADVWALGTILYECLTGRTPFEGDSVASLKQAILGSEAPRVGALRPGVPASLEESIMRCLRKQREERFGDVAEFAGAIAEVAPPGAQASIARVRRILHRERADGEAAEPRSEDLELPAGRATLATTGVLGAKPRTARALPSAQWLWGFAFAALASAATWVATPARSGAPRPAPSQPSALPPAPPPPPSSPPEPAQSSSQPPAASAPSVERPQTRPARPPSPRASGRPRATFDPEHAFDDVE